MKIETTLGAAVVLAAVGAAGAADCGEISLGAGERVPFALAGSGLLAEHAIAESLVHLLPAEHRDAVISAGGFGAEWGAGVVSHASLGGAAGVIAAIASPQVRARLSADQLGILDAMAATALRGEPLPQLCFAPGTDPEFFDMVNSLFEFSNGMGPRFQQDNGWTRTATDGSGLSEGTPITLTYSFMPDGTQIRNINIGLGSGVSSLFSWLNGIYGSPSQWQPLFAQVFARWSELIGVSYVYEPNDDGSQSNTAQGVLGDRGDVRIGAFNFANDSSNGAVLAYNNFPNDGDMIFDRDTFFNNTANNSRRLRNVAAHEHGHGLGMLHVCPINQTKLMEPTVTTQYDGPQLDDILNGQRFYGDKYEPWSDDPTAAPSLGSFAVGGIAALINVSLDDNSDTDFYEITLGVAAELQVTVAPDAGVYSQGPQTGNCNSGSSANYNAIHDMSISLVTPSDPFTPLASVDATGEGGTETLIFTVSPGDYVIQISGSATNNIQRYALGLFVSSAGACSTADLAEPYGTLNFFDTSAFLSFYNAQDSAADIAAPFGTWNFFDVSAFLAIYNAGCP